MHRELAFNFYVVLGLEPKAFTLSHFTSPFFFMGFFKIESHNLFALSGFELQSS
jgi:hypothetical protein